MNILELISFLAIAAPLRYFYRLFRITHKRKSYYNMWAVILGGFLYIITLGYLNDPIMQLILTAFVTGLGYILFKGYMDLINKEYREKLLDDLVAMIENYERLHSKQNSKK